MNEIGGWSIARLNQSADLEFKIESGSGFAPPDDDGAILGHPFGRRLLLSLSHCLGQLMLSQPMLHRIPAREDQKSNKRKAGLVVQR